MTNAEKFLKDGAGGVQDFTEALMKFNEERKFVTEWYAKAHSKDCIDLFLNEQAKPQLTEDERVILRNLHYEKGCYEYERIGRTKKDSEGYSDLYLIEKDLTVTNFNEYLHLFQFIKERRRI